MAENNPQAQTPPNGNPKPQVTETRMSAWRKQSFGKKFFFVVRIAFLILGLAGFVVFLLGRQVFGSEWADKYFGENLNGWDVLWNGIVSTSQSWFLTLITLAVASVVSMVVDFIIRIASPKNRRGKTIMSLVRSLTHYAVAIVAVGVILSAWGVNIAGIIAGVGVLTLVIGLGCQSLVQDIVSGVFIVFDDYFAVGDTVVIDGFRGTIIYVGLRTTKIQDAAGNIKCINNSSIQTVANLARTDSIASASLDASYNEDPRRVEAIIANNLDKIRKKIPAITEGPFYKGISGFSPAGVTYLVIAKCDESNRFQVCRDLNRELYLLFIDNNIIVPYNQITVNPADPSDRPKPTPANLKASEKITNELRGIGPKAAPKKEENFVKRFGKTVRNAAIEAMENEE